MNKYQWNISLKDSAIYFKVKYLQISFIKGMFKKFKGVVITDTYFKMLEVNLALDSSSIETYNTKQNQTLKSDIYLASAEYPAIKFAATDGCTLRSGKIWELTGLLSVKNTTSPVTMVVTLSNINTRDKIQHARFNLHGKINLQELGLLHPQGKVISDDIELFAEITLIKSVRPH